MLPSEFFEKTGVNLTSEEYAKVEHIYMSVKMDQAEFCKLWLENRDNKIISELMETITEFEKENSDFEVKIGSLKRKIEQNKLEYEKEITKVKEQYLWKMNDLGKRIVTNINDETRIYDILEEEFTLDFIIRAKLEENLDLMQHEREHLIKKL